MRERQREGEREREREERETTIMIIDIMIVCAFADMSCVLFVTWVCMCEYMIALTFL